MQREECKFKVVLVLQLLLIVEKANSNWKGLVTSGGTMIAIGVLF